MRKKEAARSSFSRGSNHQQRGARSVRILRREKASARSICSRFRPGTDLAQLLPNVSPLQRELDVVLLHEGILEPALASRRSPSPRKRISPTNAKRQTRSLRLTPAKRRFRFCSTRATSKKSSRSRPQTKSCRKNPPTFSPSSSVESRCIASSAPKMRKARKRAFQKKQSQKTF